MRDSFTKTLLVLYPNWYPIYPLCPTKPSTSTEHCHGALERENGVFESGENSAAENSDFLATLKWRNFGLLR